MSEPWLSADDISEHLAVTKDNAYAWIADNGMPAQIFGRLWKLRAREDDVRVWSGGTSAGGAA